MKIKYIPLWMISILILLAIPGSALGDYSEQFNLPGNELVLGNLIGEIEFTGYDGSGFEIQVQVRGNDAEPGMLEFETEEGSPSILMIHFPIDEERDYVYPELGRRSKTRISFNRNRGDSSGWLDRLIGDLGRDRIEVRGRGNGMEIWADVQIQVPRGGSVLLEHGVGIVLANDIDGHADLSVKSGRVEAARIQGGLRADTGSGSVSAEDIQGDVDIDTGSGSVYAAGCKGTRFRADTGSGSVEVNGVEAEEVEIDTGSGSVEVENVICEDLGVDTGSGGVKGRGLEVGEVEVDTGSGSIRLHFDRMGEGPFVFDTGSGGITLYVPEDISATCTAETGSGGIDLDLEDVDILKKGRDYMRFEIGGGRAEMDLDTGSGSIRISSR